MSATTQQPEVKLGLSLATCARKLDCGKNLIRSLIDAGELDSFRIGGNQMILVTPASFEAYYKKVTAHIVTE